jgi:hypothetical protein
MNSLLLHKLFQPTWWVELQQIGQPVSLCGVVMMRLAKVVMRHSSLPLATFLHVGNTPPQLEDDVTCTENGVDK